MLLITKKQLQLESPVHLILSNIAVLVLSIFFYTRLSTSLGSKKFMSLGLRLTLALLYPIMILNETNSKPGV